MSETTNSFGFGLGSAAAAAAGAAAEFLGSHKASGPDLHDPALDPTGRVDVLGARALRLAVAKIQDPMLQALYEQFRPVIDHQLHAALGKVKTEAVLEKLGIVNPRPRKKKTGVKKAARKAAAK